MPVRLSEPPLAAATGPAPSVPHGKGAGVPAISVVVPVYNVEKFLAECIESVLAQTFTDFELLLVDDGSPDASGKICDDFAARDSRIRVFHKPNGGVSSARNLGLQNARGEWICFVDADDRVAADALAVYSACEPTADIIVSGAQYFDSASGRNKQRIIPAEEVRTGNEIGEFYLRLGLRGLINQPWNKCFRRKFLYENALAFPLGIALAEDTLFVTQCFRAAKKVQSVSSVTYFVRRGTESASSRFNTNFWETHERLLKEIFALAAERGEAGTPEFFRYLSRRFWFVPSAVSHRKCPLSFAERCDFVRRALELLPREGRKFYGKLILTNNPTMILAYQKCFSLLVRAKRALCAKGGAK